MRRRVLVLREAAEEAIAAARWYERQRPGLGVQFERDLRSAIALLKERDSILHRLPEPNADPPLKRLRLRRFPYDVVLLVRTDDMIVIAVAHRARRPGYWRGRIG